MVNLKAVVCMKMYTFGTIGTHNHTLMHPTIQCETMATYLDAFLYCTAAKCRCHSSTSPYSKWPNSSDLRGFHYDLRQWIVELVVYMRWVKAKKWQVCIKVKLWTGFAIKCLHNVNNRKISCSLTSVAADIVEQFILKVRTKCTEFVQPSLLHQQLSLPCFPFSIVTQPTLPTVVTQLPPSSNLGAAIIAGQYWPSFTCLPQMWLSN